MRILQVFAAGIICCLLGAGTAAAAPDFKIGYVDIQRALAASSAGKEAQKKYEEEVKRLQGKLDIKKNEFEKLQQSYQKQKDSLNAKARSDKEEELLSQEKELKRTYQDSQEALRRKNGQLVGELVEKLKKIVDEFGKTEGYTVILEKGAQSVLYADTRVDVTDSIVRKFDDATK